MNRCSLGKMLIFVLLIFLSFVCMEVRRNQIVVLSFFQNIRDICQSKRKDGIGKLKYLRRQKFIVAARRS